MKVVFFGAGGPVAQAGVRATQNLHSVRLADLDVDLLKDSAPALERVKCDLGNPGEVLEAAAGMDAIVNCAVNRLHPKGAFDVNVRGALNVMRAAQAHGITKVVHTGPQLIHMGHTGDYSFDWDVPDDVPPRPGTNLYPMTKYLAQEICRIFAEEHGIQVITLLFSGLTGENGPAYKARHLRGYYPYTVSWDDAGEAIRCALEAGPLPRPHEAIDILTDAPPGFFRMTKAKELLGWEPKDRLDSGWKRTGHESGS